MSNDATYREDPRRDLGLWLLFGVLRGDDRDRGRVLGPLLGDWLGRDDPGRPVELRMHVGEPAEQFVRRRARGHARRICE